MARVLWPIISSRNAHPTQLWNYFRHYRNVMVNLKPGEYKRRIFTLDPTSAFRSTWCQTWSCCLSLFSAFCSLATSASAWCNLFFASANAGSSSVPCAAWASTSDKRRLSDSQFLLSRSNASSFTRKEQKMKPHVNKKINYALQLPTTAEQLSSSGVSYLRPSRAQTQGTHRK